MIRALIERILGDELLTRQREKDLVLLQHEQALLRSLLISDSLNVRVIRKQNTFIRLIKELLLLR